MSAYDPKRTSPVTSQPVEQSILVLVGNNAIGSEAVTVFAFEHLHEEVTVACVHFLIRMPCHRLYTFLAQRARTLDGFGHCALPLLLQAGALSVSQPPTPGTESQPVMREECA
jgi:hypothetical protein